MKKVELQIGELAKRTGVTARTLRYYDQIGLLTPATSTAAGYRIYRQPEIIRLQQIRSLQQLGFSLQAIQQCLDSQNISIVDVLQMHSRQMQQQLQQLTNLCDRLDKMLQDLEMESSVSVDVFLNLIQETTMFDQYYTSEQLEQLQQRGSQIGQDRINQVEQEWRDLIAAVEYEQQQKTDPASTRMQELAAQWQSLINEFTGGDPEIAAALSQMNRTNPELAQQRGYGLDSGLMDYVGQALQAASKT